ncbi:MAG: hypothetical protein ABW275_08625 [Hansschlegelia sp.]
MMDFQPIRVATGTADEDGRLVLVDGRLVAVIVRLVDESHGPAIGQWSLEAGFNGVESVKPPLFANLAAAERWIDLQLR